MFRLLLFLLFILLFQPISHGREIPETTTTTTQYNPARKLAENTTTSSSCPLDISTVRSLVKQADISPSYNATTNCARILGIIRIVLAEYLKSTGSFYPPANSDDSCWDSFDSAVDSVMPGFGIIPTCGFQNSWLSEGCMNITNRSEFDRVVGPSSLTDAVSNCNQSLDDSSMCASCLTSLSTMRASHLSGPSYGNVSDCTNLPFIYASSVINQYGPSDPGTAKCLLSVALSAGQTGKDVVLISVFSVVGFVLLCLICGGYFLFWRFKKRKEREARKKRRLGPVASGSGSGSGSNLNSINGSTHLIKFSYDEIKQATKKFHRDNLIGKGGYGNVYKGVLPNGSEVAIKRFKNCSAAGDESFTHEVEVIASIRHVNLVELRGYCVATTNLEGHQRMIVCDLMKNGSLHDHLYGDDLEKKLSWPIRQKIALGMARGLAYLHYGAQISVIHRDIKASNILLDENFEAKVADFGLAKFNPEGFSHLSTRVAGTMGYVAPEYALYGQLTERSDVYSFGVVLLELLSGKKAIMSPNDGSQGQPSLVTDWAWALVKKGHTLDVIEDGMPETGPDSVMEKYVMTAVLCSHPQLYARPTMDQVVKILETDLAVPCIPERPISFLADVEEIEKSTSSSGSGHFSNSESSRPYSMGNIDYYPSHNEEENEEDPTKTLR